jgi:hypothetical protein
LQYKSVCKSEIILLINFIGREYKMDKFKKEQEANTQNNEANKYPWELMMMLAALVVSGIIIALKIFGVF